MADDSRGEVMTMNEEITAERGALHLRKFSQTDTDIVHPHIRQTVNVDSTDNENAIELYFL